MSGSSGAVRKFDLLGLLSKSMMGLREYLFSSYHERAFDEAHFRPRLTNCLHTPSHTPSFCRPNVSMDARTSQEVSRLSFACVSVLAVAAQQVARHHVVSERSQEERLLSV